MQLHVFLRSAGAAPVVLELIAAISDKLSATSAAPIVPSLTHIAKGGVLNWGARAAEKYREAAAMVLELASSTPTATPKPHIRKLS
jgi:hypothetical protein